MLIEVEVIWRLRKRTACDLHKSERKWFLNTYAVDSEYSDDNQQTSKNKYWHELYDEKVNIIMYIDLESFINHEYEKLLSFALERSCSDVCKSERISCVIILW